jgi:hypothetical protein
MTVPARLLAFAALLAGVFAAAALAGAQADLGRTAPPAAEGEHAMGQQEADPVRGLSVSEDDLTLKMERRTAAPGRPFELRFRILDSRGRTVRDFDVEHTRRMHLIVARRDLTGFQHLHPTQRGDGSWSVRATFPEPGTYRVFADFSTADTPRTLGADLTVDGPATSRALPAPRRSVTVDGLKVALTSGAAKAGHEAELGFAVTRGGRTVEVQPYLGARGHLVALREGDLAFLHVHPDADRLRFMASFPSPGRYRLFLQFKTGGRIHTAAFTQEVGR